MKKVLALIIALAMCISLAACSAPATAAGGDAKASSDGFSVDVFIFNFANTTGTTLAFMYIPPTVLSKAHCISIKTYKFFCEIVSHVSTIINYKRI